MIKFDYQKLACDRHVFFITPGLFENRGGMLEYAKLWQNEANQERIATTFCVPSNRYRDFNHPKIAVADPSNYKLISFAIALLRLILPEYLIKKAIFIGYKKIPFKAGDIIHITAAYLHIDLLLDFLLGIAKKKELTVIYTLHDPVPHDENKGNFLVTILRNRYFKFLYNNAINKENFVIHIHNESIIPEFLKGSNANILIYPHPKGIKKAKRNRSDNSILLGFLGQIHPYKGLDILQKAITEIDKFLLTRNVKIIIAGSGNIENIEAWFSLETPVTIKNQFLSDNDFHEIMANLDCLILPYREATQTGVGVMANTYDIPIIATNVGGLPELIKDCKKGYLCAPTSEAMKETIMEFIESV